MATMFSDLYPYIRALLGDTDDQRLIYSNAVLDSHIRLRIMTEDNLDLQESGIPLAFTTDLSAYLKAKTIYQVCKSIIANMPNDFAFRTPVHSVSRKGGPMQLMLYLDTQLDELDGSLIRYDTELDAILNGAERFYQNFTDALGNA